MLICLVDIFTNKYSVVAYLIDYKDKCKMNKERMLKEKFLEYWQNTYLEKEKPRTSEEEMQDQLGKER